MEPYNERISISRQCELFGISRGAYYYHPVGINKIELLYSRLLDEEYTRHPFYGVERMMRHLRGLGHPVGPKRVRKLLRQMGLSAVGPKPNTSKGNPGHKIYPYLLRGLAITGPNHVWSTDITYIRLRDGFVYLTAVIDWFSRYVLSWRLSLNLDTTFCLEALSEALSVAKPQIFNTDQGSQFTSQEFTTTLESAGIRVSMDGRGRALDNVFVERLWRSVKYEEVYLKDYSSVWEAERSLAAYFEFYNLERRHQGIDWRLPFEVYSDFQADCAS